MKANSNKSIADIVSSGGYKIIKNEKIILPGKQGKTNDCDKMSRLAIKEDHIYQTIYHPERITDTLIEDIKKFEGFAKQNGLPIKTKIKPLRENAIWVDDNAYDAMMDIIKNAKPKNGFVDFDSRDWDRDGDRYTWASWDSGTLVVKKADSEDISEEYHSDISKYCEKYGMCFDDIESGEMATL